MKLRDADEFRFKGCLQWTENIKNNIVRRHCISKANIMFLLFMQEGFHYVLKYITMYFIVLFDYVLTMVVVIALYIA